jgi:hypothetical protein
MLNEQMSREWKSPSIVTVFGGRSMDEIIFIVEEAPEGGYVARALGESIVTAADDQESLHVQVRDAVRCHFDEDAIPKIIRLHYVHEEVFAV